MSQLNLLEAIKYSNMEEKYILTDMNRPLYEKLMQISDGAQLIIGSASSGKSHLARLWQKKHDAIFIDPQIKEYRQTIYSGSAFIIEDLHLWSQDNHQKLFDLFNIIVFEKKAKLLLTSRQSPLQIGSKIRDLTSRLLAIETHHIPDTDERLMRKILIQNFQQMRIEISPGTIDFLLLRLPRSYAIIVKICKKISDFSLTYNQTITIPTLRKLLSDYFVDNMEQSDSVYKNHADQQSCA